jgi:hypothetical protein
VRGGSHAGNIATQELARAGALDARSRGLPWRRHRRFSRARGHAAAVDLRRQ